MLGTDQEAAQEQRLVRIRGHRRLARAAVARPADLGDDDGLAGKSLLQTVELREGVVDRDIDGHPFPVGQQMDPDEVHMVDQVRMRQPDVPGLGGTDRLADGLARPVQVLADLLRGQLAAQHHFVADEHPHHVGVSARNLDRPLQLLVVAVPVIVYPGAEGDVDVMPRGQLRDIGERALHTVRADGIGLARQELQIGVDLGVGRHLMPSGVFVSPERGEGKPLDTGWPRRLRRRAIEKCPYRERQGRERRRNKQSG